MIDLTQLPTTPSAPVEAEQPAPNTFMLVENVDGKLAVVHTACATRPMWIMRHGEVILTGVYERRCPLCQQWMTV